MGRLDRKMEFMKLLNRVFYRVPSDILSHRERARMDLYIEELLTENENMRNQIRELERILDESGGKSVGFSSSTETYSQQKGSKAQERNEFQH